MAEAPPSPESRLSLALTGHRDSNPAFAANREAVLATLAALFDQVESAARESVDGLGRLVPVRLHSLIADGADQAGFDLGQQRGWELVAPLPVGRNLNLAINAHPISVDDAEALLAGGTAPHPECEAGAAAIRTWYGQAQLFELADHDEVLTAQFLESLANPNDRDAAHRAQAGISAQVALAGRVMIEQSDLMIAIWDGRSSNLVGGTGHTIAAALERGVGLVGERMGHRERTARAGLNDSVASHDLTLRTSCCWRTGESRAHSSCPASRRRSCAAPGAGRRRAARG